VVGFPKARPKRRHGQPICKSVGNFAGDYIAILAHTEVAVIDLREHHSVGKQGVPRRIAPRMDLNHFLPTLEHAQRDTLNDVERDDLATEHSHRVTRQREQRWSARR
jgi:hypothetical protein